MESAFAWLGQLFDWFGQFVPRWKVIRATHGGVKFVSGKKVQVVRPGIIWYWPVTTEIEIIPTARDTINLQSQTVTTSDDKPILLSAMVVVEVRDAVKLLTTTHDPGGLVADVTLAAIYAVVGGFSWAQIKDLQRTGELGKQLRLQTRRRLEKYGVWVDDVMLTDFAPCRVIRLVQTDN